ncbi:hypothetical protein FSP39_024675 [Pinctada imbricata]|uniref:Uncharacterized protein n=1 Tax=Pinctada imbricata TaxID=66713 RepID=A0AA88XNX9_PINIB|nr:hypothetical protein FSP39_024675 [Pinctada imbricata]
MYSNCTCIPDGKASAGFCKTDCAMIYPWAIVNFLSSVAGAMKIMPNRIIMIRCVKDTDKATAIGLSAFLGSALGWALSPIFYGKMVDTTCLIWQSSCEGHGACEFYDIEDFRLKFHTFGFVFKMLALFTSLFSLWKVWNWKHWESDCESNNEKINHSIPEKQTIMSNDKELEEHS